MQVGGLPVLRCRALEPFADHLFTTRGWLLGSRTDAADDGWAEVAGALGVPLTALARLHQVHGAAVRRATSANSMDRPAADIVVTSEDAVAVAVQAADCVPLLAADRRTGAVGAAHAGWRGLAVHVPTELISAMTREFGSEPDDLLVAIGPSIGACCYEVGIDVRDAFRAAFGERNLSRWFFDDPCPTAINPSMARIGQARRADHWFFDGWSATRDQLECAGVPASQIHTAQLCTASHPDLLCSYRRDGKPAGRMAGVIRRG